jgi:hypothetical protein
MFLKNFSISRDEQSLLHSQSNPISSGLNEARPGGLSLVVGGLHQPYSQQVLSRRSASELLDIYPVLNESTSKKVVLAPCGFWNGVAEFLNIPLNEEDSAYSQDNHRQYGFSDYAPIQNYRGNSDGFSEYVSAPVDHGASSSPHVSPYGYDGHGSLAHFHSYYSHSHYDGHGSSAHFHPYHSHSYYGGYDSFVHSNSYNAHSHDSVSVRQHSRTVGSRTVTLVNDFSDRGCTIACIAMVANVPYSKAEKLAVEIDGFDGSSGVGFDSASEILTSLGVKNTRHSNSGELDVRSASFPDLAIVCVKDSDASGLHAVVAVYTANGVTIFDGNHPHPRVPSDYTFEPDYSYIEIHH